MVLIRLTYSRYHTCTYHGYKHKITMEKEDQKCGINN